MKLLVTEVEFDFDDGFIPLTKYEEDNIMTTSCALVLIKNGRLITLAKRCISAPNVADTCKTTK